MDQLFGRADLLLRANMGGPVASAVMETTIGRRPYLERAATLLTNLFRPEVLTNRVGQLSTRVRPALEGNDTRDKAAAARQLTERIVGRVANLEKQLREPELKPIAFVNGMAKLPAWRALDAPEGGGMDQAKAADGRAALRIKAGPTTSSSWRTKILLISNRCVWSGSPERKRTSALGLIHFSSRIKLGLACRTRSPVWAVRWARINPVPSPPHIGAWCWQRARAIPLPPGRLWSVYVEFTGVRFTLTSGAGATARTTRRI
jgi:hypothetical protein